MTVKKYISELAKALMLGDSERFQNAHFRWSMWGDGINKPWEQAIDEILPLSAKDNESEPMERQ